ncbi:hypothetical protein [Leisingera sp. JC1]|uniref:hypothetical protein n=1 Tax=Leisingera sp. JC1 TaxID=1855282 RepID=UPI0008037EF7|nr:hypothetical protein [Leisingera sp. JC1]OBY26575.1 hypothetical protein A9D60_18650 [Leisingera sp. JC1]
MLAFARSPQEAVFLSAVFCGCLALALSGLLRWRGSPRVPTDLQIPAFFVLAYWLTYNRVPSLPPVGAVNKLFYIAVTGAAAGLLLEACGLTAKLRWFFLGFPIVAAVFIGQSRLSTAPHEVVLAAGLGALVFDLLIREMLRSDGETDLRPAIMLAIASTGFAPIALLGASSSSLQLCLSLAAAIGGILAWHLFHPRFSFGAASLLGGAGALVAVGQTVAMITRKVDLLALFILGLVFVVPLVGERLLSQRPVTRPAIRTLRFAALCLIPALAAVSLAILRYDGNFPV